jgi:hypothetical protein
MLGRRTAPLEAEVRAGLLHDLPLERGVEYRALPGDPGAVDDVELGLFERRRDLVLHHFTRTRFPYASTPSLSARPPGVVSGFPNMTPIFSRS